MNILIVSPWDLTYTGGVTSAVGMLACELLHKGHSTTVLVTGNGDNPSLINDRDGVPVYEMCFRLPVSNVNRLRACAAFFIMLPATLYRLYRFLSRRSIEGVVIQYPLAPCFYFGILRRLCSWKLLVVYQGSDAHELHTWSSVERRLVHWLLKSSDCIIAVSESLLKKVFHVFPDLKKKASCLIPNGAPLRWADCNRGPSIPQGIPDAYVLSAGRLIHRKGFDILIDALKLMRHRGEDLNVVIAGDGPELSNLLQVAKQAGVHKQLHFLGDQPHERVFDLMKGCMFFVLPSRAEGLPLVIAEAMACGKAVIATDVDGIPDILHHGRTGLLVRPDDAQSLADALARLRDDVAWRRELGETAKKWAMERFNWSNIADQYLQRLMCQEVR